MQPDGTVNYYGISSRSFPGLLSWNHAIGGDNRENRGMETAQNRFFRIHQRSLNGGLSVRLRLRLAIWNSSVQTISSCSLRNRSGLGSRHLA